MKRLASALLLCLTAYPLVAFANPAADNPQPLNCLHGPITKSFGNTSWLTYSCSDGKTLVIVSAPGSPAAPFVFTIFPQADVYRVTGEGTGPKPETDQAYAALSKLSTQDFQAIIKETLEVPATPMPPRARRRLAPNR